MDHQITTWLASSERLETLPEPSADAWRKELRWLCRFMTDAQLQSVMNQVMSAHPYQDPQQEVERLKAVHEVRVKIVPRV